MIQGLSVVTYAATISVVLILALIIFWIPIVQFVEHTRLNWKFKRVSEQTLLTLKPGDSFLECEEEQYCPEMIILPQGKYVSGARYESPENSEIPSRIVSINYTFAVGQFEITQAQWKVCESLPAGNINQTCDSRTESSQDDKNPVFNISWNDANMYISWLNNILKYDEGNGYRLLSEAEWEYSIRAETTPNASEKYYFWGNDIQHACKYGNFVNAATQEGGRYNVQWPVTNCDDRYVELSPVGSFLPNEFNIYDMAGNVSEWVYDCWHPDYTGAPNDGSAWTSHAPKNCDRVVRGGSWIGRLDRIRSAARSKARSTAKGRNIGFRVALTLE